jgi:hypothetical protein
MKKRIILSRLWISLLASGIFFVSCDNPAGPPVVYPYIQYQIGYMGIKPGLTSSSTDKAFIDGLNEIIKSYQVTHPIDDEVNIDGVIYGLTNWQSIKPDDVPPPVDYLFWEKMRKENYDVGSCFWFYYYKIPEKKEIGDYYYIYAIVKERKLLTWGIYRKADIYPK